MFPALVSRFTKLVLLGSAVALIAGGDIPHASAQKGGYIQDVDRSTSSFFSFNIPGTQGAVIEAAMVSALDAGKIDTRDFRDPAVMKVFYDHRNMRPVWVDRRATDYSNAKQILQVLDESWSHGLNPDNYHVDAIRLLLRSDRPADRAQLDLLLSDAVIRYGHDITGLRLSPRELNQDAQYWRVPIAAADVLQQVSANGSGAAAALRGLAPTDALYQRLRQELQTLVTHPDRGYEQYLPLNFGGVSLRPGEVNVSVPKLRARMGVAYDADYGPEKLYDDPLAAAVMNFQHQNGLTADGIIGPKTLVLLNRSTRDQIEQIVANMERLRWVDDRKPDKYIIVNIPSATLWAIEDKEVAFEMPVIVGRPERATKSFVTEITGVRFNPKWTVPPTIKAKDFLPKLVEDPTYLLNKGIEVSILVDGKRETLDSTAIDWANVTRADLARMRMTQAAGDNNALGRVRVLMDNPYDIYLHDTNAPEFFNKPDRALSSGCIRMSKPEDVANFILHGNKGWSNERMQGIFARERTAEVNTENKVPVYILYQTIWLDDKGQLIYGPDIYQQDRRVLDVMTKAKAYKIPDANALKYAGIGPEMPVQ